MDIKPALLLFPRPSRKDRSPSPQVLYPSSSDSSLGSTFSKIFDMLRSGEVPEPPAVVLYSNTGAHDLSEAIRIMWSSSEAEWLNSLDKVERYSITNRDKRLEAFRSLQLLWARALSEVAEKDSTSADES